MSVFRNRTGAKLIIDKANHSKFVLEPGATFTGNNFYKRFTTGTNPVLELVTDDGAPYVDGNLASGAVPRSYTVAVSGAFANNEIDILTDVGGPAHWVQIETDALVLVRLNEDTNSDFYLSANSIQVFNRGDLLIEKIQFDATFSGAGSPNVEVVVAATPV